MDHGDYSMYTTGACRLPCCRAAATRQQNVYRMRKMAGPLKVPAIGAIRRIRALHALGYPLRAISTELGSASGGSLWSILYKDRQTIGRDLHDRVCAMYDRLSATPGPSETSRAQALSKGWAPPLAWGDDIDDPNAKPEGVRVKDTPTLDLDDWWYLVRCGENPARAAERCGVTLSAVERMAWRHGRPELASIAGSARKRWSAA